MLNTSMESSWFGASKRLTLQLRGKSRNIEIDLEKESTTVMMHVPKLRLEQRTKVPGLAAAATVGTQDAATSSQRFIMPSNLVPDPGDRHPCAFDLKQPCAWSEKSKLVLQTSIDYRQC